MALKKWLAAALSVTAALVLAACGQSKNTDTSAEKVLRVGVNAEFAPFESLDENKNVQGFDIDLLKAMAEAGGFKVEFRHQPWDSLFPALANGDFDVVISAVTMTDERKASMDFTDPYYQISQVILAPANKDIKSTEDLKKLNKVGVVTGQTGDFAAQKIFGATSPKIVRFDTVTLLTKEVENGGVEAAISDSAVIKHYLKHNPNEGFTIVTAPDFEVENYGIVTRKGDKATVDMLNAALKKVRENGKYAEIEAKYFAN